MTAYTITTLRDQLSETMDSLRDKENPMDIDRAKVITDIAQVIINSAKVEVEFMRVNGGMGTGFIPEAPDKPETSLPEGTTRSAPGVLVHKMKW